MKFKEKYETSASFILRSINIDKETNKIYIDATIDRKECYITFDHDFEKWEISQGAGYHKVKHKKLFKEIEDSTELKSKVLSRISDNLSRITTGKWRNNKGLFTDITL